MNDDPNSPKGHGILGDLSSHLAKSTSGTQPSILNLLKYSMNARRFISDYFLNASRTVPLLDYSRVISKTSSKINEALIRSLALTITTRLSRKYAESNHQLLATSDRKQTAQDFIQKSTPSPGFKDKRESVMENLISDSLNAPIEKNIASLSLLNKTQSILLGSVYMATRITAALLPLVRKKIGTIFPYSFIGNVSPLTKVLQSSASRRAIKDRRQRRPDLPYLEKNSPSHGVVSSNENNNLPKVLVVDRLPKQSDEKIGMVHTPPGEVSTGDAARPTPSMAAPESLPEHKLPLNAESSLPEDVIRIVVDLPKLIQSSLRSISYPSRSKFQYSKDGSQPRKLDLQRPSLSDQATNIFSPLQRYIITSRLAQSTGGARPSYGTTKLITHIQASASLTKMSSKISSFADAASIHLRSSILLSGLIAGISDSAKKLIARNTAADNSLPISILGRISIPRATSIVAGIGSSLNLKNALPTMSRLVAFSSDSQSTKNIAKDVLQRAANIDFSDEPIAVQRAYDRRSIYESKQLKTSANSIYENEPKNPLKFIPRLIFSASIIDEQFKKTISASIGSVYPHRNDNSQIATPDSSPKKDLNAKVEESQNSVKTLDNKDRLIQDMTRTVVHMKQGGIIARRKKLNFDSIRDLQGTYSRFTLRNIINREPKQGGSISLKIVQNSAHLTAPLSLPRKTMSASKNMNDYDTSISLRKLQDGSIDLPLVSQLQALLTDHAIKMTGIAATTTLTHLSQQPPDFANIRVRSRSSPRTGLSASGTLAQEKILDSGGRGAAEKILSSSSSSRNFGEGQRQRVNDYHMRASQRTDNKSEFSSLRDLRKKIEQIFQEELKRYGF